MNIVVLDGYTLNPGDISWEPVRHFGDVTVYDRTPADLIVDRAAGAEIVLTNKTPITRKTIGRLPEMTYIGVLATGYNVVDLQAAAERGIPVTNTPDYGTGSVAQHVFALLLEMSNSAQLHSDAVHNGEWAACPDFTFTKAPMVELAGKTMGIVGFGRIGEQTARIAAAFGMKLLAASRTAKQPAGLDVTFVEMERLFAESDVISLHCPLTPSTQGMINKQALDRMKPSAFLINTSRGPLIAEQDLADALNEGRIAGAALDVLSSEPPKADNPLFSAKNCLITPHIAWATKEARSRLMNIAVGNIDAFLQGKPVNVVNR